MFRVSNLGVVAALASSVLAGTTIWSGSFNSYQNVSDFDLWSWSDEVGEYQWYIHGSGPTSDYLALSPSYKNPADTSETNGVQYTLDSSAVWNSDGMERTELIPQTTENLGTGELFYHFSLGFAETNLPNTAYEHQIFFFESHFTELKIGVSPNPTELQWMVNSVYQWGTPIVAGGWNNFAYDINFSSGTVSLYASTGSSPLVQVAGPVSVDASTNSEDWHVGMLRLNVGTDTEFYYVSGVYIEEGPITTSVGSGTGVSSSSSGTGTTTTTSSSTTTISSSSSSSSSISTTTTSSTTTSSGPTQTEYGQCGGTGYTGATACQSPFVCTAISPPYYYQCLAA